MEMLLLPQYFHLPSSLQALISKDGVTQVGNVREKGKTK